MKKYSLYFVLLLLLFSSCSDERVEYVVKKTDLVEAVYSSASVKPVDVYTVKSTVGGYLDGILHQEGDLISKGELLFVIRDIAGSNSEDNARLAYELAQKNLVGERSVLRDMELEIANLALKRKNDSLNYARNKALYDSGGITKIELEQSQLLYESARSSHLSAINRYNRTERELRTSLEQARNNYNSSASRSDDAHISSVLNGRVYSVLKEKGDLVSIQEPIAVIGSATEFEIELLVDEVDIAKVREGQLMYINMEAFPGKVFEAEVVRIVPKMDEQTQTFKVVGKFRNAPSQLYMGLSGEASIVIEERKNVIAIPREYINDKGEVETEAGFKKLKLGVKSLSDVEVLEGLNPGEIIYKPEN